jgi:polyisoprenyl-phosphate glycosyltransferase
MSDTMHSKMLDYSIIVPVYFNEGCLLQTMSSISKEVIDTNPQYSCEVIFVDDGSGDNSLKELLSIRKDYPNIVKVIKLSRNFGQICALLAGFSHARGKCVVAISADGQDPPSLINDMLKAYFQDGYEIAVCTRKGRDESFFRVVTSRFFYSLMKKLTFSNMPIGGFDFALLGERALKTFLKNIDHSPFFQGQILWMGFKIKFIEYHRIKRLAGNSRWSFGKKVTYLLDGVLAYSFFPIRLISTIGIVFSLFGFLYAFVILFSRLVYGNPMQGWAPLMITILVMGGIQMLMLGIIGEYLWRALAEARGREFYIIDTIYEGKITNYAEE